MALELLTTTYEFDEAVPDNPAQPDGRYSMSYLRTTRTWNTTTKLVQQERKPGIYRGGYPGAPPEPQDYYRLTSDILDAYPVPGAGQPGYVAGKEGRYVTITHDGEGDVTRTYADVCDLQLKNAVGIAPAAGQATGRVDFEASTSAEWVSAALLDATLSQGPGIPLEQVPPGRLSIQQVPPGTYILSVKDARGCVAGQFPPLLVTVPASPPPVVYGCMDEDATNFDPEATQDNGTCRYSPRFVGLWHPDGVRASVLPAAGAAFVSGELWAGFPLGHPLQAFRPETKVADVTATVSPRTGRAEFNLAPYLRAQVGSLQSDGTRRLDINAATATTYDQLVGYRLLVGGKSVHHGYALNSVLSEAELGDGTQARILSPFGKTLPVWVGYPYELTVLRTEASGRYGMVELIAPENDQDTGQRLVVMPCPRNGVPVAWLAPDGSFGYWVFSGNHQHTDDIAEGQAYTEALTGEQRLSSRTGSRAGMELYSGAYAHRALVEGLRTLRRAVQAWYQPGGPGTEWLAVTVRSGSIPAYREGRNRYETTIQLTEARPQYVQGQ